MYFLQHQIVGNSKSRNKCMISVEFQKHFQFFLQCYQLKVNFR